MTSLMSTLVQRLPQPLKRPLRRMKRLGEELKPKNDPDFLIIGAQKSGTTSLHFYLNQHAEMSGSRPKETHFFNKHLYFGCRPADYQSCFRGGVGKYYFEATPAYLYHPGSAENIKKYYPNIKLVILLREPGDRAYSAWNHYRQLFPRWIRDESIKHQKRRSGNRLYKQLFENRDQFPCFRDCLELELDLMRRDPTSYEPALLRRGLYHDQLNHYYSIFSAEQIKVIGFKEFTQNIDNTLNSICQFIGVSTTNWRNLECEPRNERNYVEPIQSADRALLDNFYAEPNARLFRDYGEFDW